MTSVFSAQNESLFLRNNPFSLGLNCEEDMTKQDPGPHCFREMKQLRVPLAVMR